MTVQFTDLSTGSSTSWNWLFGDGYTSPLKNPDHTYSAAGICAVSLEAANVIGSNMATKTGYVVVMAAPTPTPTLTIPPS